MRLIGVQRLCQADGSTVILLAVQIHLQIFLDLLRFLCLGHIEEQRAEIGLVIGIAERTVQNDNQQHDAESPHKDDRQNDRDRTEHTGM